MPSGSSSDAVRHWASVDAFLADQLAPHDDILDAVLAANAEASLPSHDVSATQGKMLALLVTMSRSARILEIGTLGGYSTIWMARALPANGRIVTIEANPHHAEVARGNIMRAGLAERIDLHVGPALEILPTLTGPFDLIFIDADKPNNPRYLDLALALSRPGTVILGDNIVRDGMVADGASDDPSVRGVREFLAMIAWDPRLNATAIQTVGQKGWDGFALAIVGDPPEGGGLDFKHH